MTTPDIAVPLLLQAVRRRPEIWATARPVKISDKRRAAAWKQICLNTWPEFDSWTVDQKRTRCLILQKKWKTLQQDFLNAQKEGSSSKRSAHHDLLTFLTADKKLRCSDVNKPNNTPLLSTVGEEGKSFSENRPSCLACGRPGQCMRLAFNLLHIRGRRLGRTNQNHTPVSQNITIRSSSEEDGRGRPAKRARAEAPEESDEDRHFLLSLESYMRDVPRSSKLALREDMMRLIRKYTPAAAAADHHHPVSDTTHSQEY